ncbi:hypothetical protein BU26DRAFT_594037 [Trematosphaeria pertusa]|uniref:Uncharacterized protein n=1 Tax=Trematosphaeria pertusa TaxID=390896 RepID=A0A6A6IKZ3_9PLEO|nr:uncharacterized protein BU26DRAFT_594037 [Trematosphaeria pertusa]KAF2250210.1 hypothetical protein BU26DRAFT_594037 [Trematosphaeria pertusa]
MQYQEGNAPALLTHDLPPRPSACLAPLPTNTMTHFADLDPRSQARVLRTCAQIAATWGILSPSSPFPIEYHPDPDTCEWGLELLDAIANLAITEADRSVAVGNVIKSIKWRNWDEEKGGPEGFMEGDYVIRVEDVEWAIEESSRKQLASSYRPREDKKRNRRRRRG